MKFDSISGAAVAVAAGLAIGCCLMAPCAGAAPPDPIADGGNSDGYDMAPETTPAVVAAANAAISTPMPPGPFEPSWKSLQEHYRVPAWLDQAKFGLSLHWGLYSVPAHHNEWYEKHMYAGLLGWHTEHYGPPERFGYKDFIPLFSAEHFDPVAWAELFRASGARFVAPTVQHHDNFALWASRVTPFNAGAMGPHRDLIGELATAVRAQGLKFGVSNHGIENFQFVNPEPALARRMQAGQVDLFDPRWADFYHVADRSDAACARFLVDWWNRNVELIEKFHPDFLWFDNGIDQRYLDPLKLRLAAYYYNRAAGWKQAVSLSAKKAAFAPSNRNSRTIGAIIDFEKIGPRSPAGIRTGNWQVHEAIGSTWGYTSDMTVSSAHTTVGKLADTVSKNGTLFLNLSPQADGTIPMAQQETLRGVGRWLAVNGEAIYGSHNWTQFALDKGQANGPKVRFTVRGTHLYAILLDPAGPVVNLAPLPALSEGSTRLLGVALLGSRDPVGFAQTESGLRLTLPPSSVGRTDLVFRIDGANVNRPTATPDGNPR